MLGWSTGGQQTYEWAVRFLAMVPRAAVFAATARNSGAQPDLRRHLDGAATSDPAFRHGFYDDPAEVRLGLQRWRSH